MGNMYEWVGYSWNPLAGECPHKCEYCYVKALVNRFSKLSTKYSGKIRIDEEALNKPLPKNKTIFVCSMNDLFADEVPKDFIEKILEVAKKQEDGKKFLFQTKNPARLLDYAFTGSFPKNSILATTIETNRITHNSNAPFTVERYSAFKILTYYESIHSYETLLSIEPIQDFDLEIFNAWLLDLSPTYISIGADSKRMGLEEPPREEIIALIKFIKSELPSKLLIKKNINRLINLKELKDDK